MQEMVIVKDKGKFEIYGSPALLNTIIEIIDLCAALPGEDDYVQSRYYDLAASVKSGEYIRIK